MNIKKIFNVFDSDKSNALDLQEMADMFEKFFEIEIDEIDIENLKKMYKIIDKTKDDALNFHEFKECALNNKANFYFKKFIMRLIKKDE